MAHTCNPSYSGSRDQENGCLKLATQEAEIRRKVV
jgi:hypothetical protein